MSVTSTEWQVRIFDISDLHMSLHNKPLYVVMDAGYRPVCTQETMCEGGSMTYARFNETVTVQVVPDNALKLGLHINNPQEIAECQGECFITPHMMERGKYEGSTALLHPRTKALMGTVDFEISRA